MPRQAIHVQGDGERDTAQLHKLHLVNDMQYM